MKTSGGLSIDAMIGPLCRRERLCLAVGLLDDVARTREGRAGSYHSCGRVHEISPQQSTTNTFNNYNTSRRQMFVHYPQPLGASGTQHPQNGQCCGGSNHTKNI
jgi:hypothetical protein